MSAGISPLLEVSGIGFLPLYLGVLAPGEEGLWNLHASKTFETKDGFGRLETPGEILEVRNLATRHPQDFK